MIYSLKKVQKVSKTSVLPSGRPVVCELISECAAAAYIAIEVMPTMRFPQRYRDAKRNLAHPLPDFPVSLTLIDAYVNSVWEKI